MATRPEVAELGERGGVERPGGDARMTERRQPLDHLAGRLVREGDDEDPTRVDDPRGDGVRDPMADDPGLARPGAGVDDEWPAGDPHGVGLVGVEVGEQPLGIPCAIAVGRG